MFNHLWVIHHSSVLVERDSFKFKIIVIYKDIHKILKIQMN